MGVTVVRYRTRPGRADENQALIEGVFRELHERGTQGVRYAAFRLDDGVSFVHVAYTESDDGTNPLTRTAAFGEFLRGIGDRCEEGPLASSATAVGTYGFGS